MLYSIFVIMKNISLVFLLTLLFEIPVIGQVSNEFYFVNALKSSSKSQVK